MLINVIKHILLFKNINIYINSYISLLESFIMMIIYFLMSKKVIEVINLIFKINPNLNHEKYNCKFKKKIIIIDHKA